MSWKQGYFSSSFVTHPASGEAILENAAVLVVDARLSQADDVVPIMEQLMRARPLPACWSLRTRCRGLPWLPW